MLLNRRHFPRRAAMALLLIAPSLNAQPSAKRATATRLTGPAPRVDGRLDDAAWRGIELIEDFEQQRPIEGATPSERTQVMFRYDDDALYIGARLFRQDPELISRSMTRRDGSGNAERLQVTFDTHLDRRTGYAFSVSAAGVRSDFHHSQDDENRGREGQYDPVWSGDARIDSLGWTAEFRIPFNQLRFPDAPSQEWGLQMDRWMPDKNEDLQWIVIPTRETGYISRFGTLTGIRGIRATRPIELLPYAATDATRAAVSDPGNPFRNPTATRFGADAKFGIGSNLTVDATINPDFGQVEADPAEVNLSAFETIVEERRPFFSEGAQLMRVEGPNYFYSRRVGAAPHLRASGSFVDQPRAATILGAARLTGRTRSRLSVGALLAVTDRESARVFDTGSALTTRVDVEPRTEYGVLRLQQEIGTQASTVGMMVTGLTRQLDDPALAALMTREAYSGGIDWRIRWKQGMYAVSGWAGYGYVAGDSQAIARIQRSSAHYFQRPDADYLDYNTSKRRMGGLTASLRADKDAGRRILWGAQVNTESPGYEVNDAGRLQSADDVEYNADIQIRETIPGKHLRNWRLGFVTRGAFNYGGDRTNEEWNQNTSLTFNNFWSLNVNWRLDRSTFDDGLTRGGPLMRTATGWGGEVRLNSPIGSRTFWRTNLNLGRDELGGWRANVGGSLTLRPAPRWSASFDPSLQRSGEPRQYITASDDATATATFGRRYVFGYVDRSTVSLRTRLNYTFSPRMTLEAYAEPFAASGRYQQIGELKAAGTNNLVVYGRDAGTSAVRDSAGNYTLGVRGQTFGLTNRDFNVLSFRSNMVLRWEWQPGSTLFVVWQQNRRDSALLGGPVTIGDLLHTTRAGGDNFLAVKLSYWIPLKAGR